jgi:shikimate 5-dehydrogenase
MNQKNMCFIGVSTSNSSIMKIFPSWSKTLGLDAVITGIDLPLNASQTEYISAINKMVSDPNCHGALVTTHKLALYQHANSLFTKFDDFAKICGEVSCIKINDQVVSGFAKDPISAGLAIRDFLPSDFFEAHNEVVLIGDGGAATAIAWYLTGLPRPPAKIHVIGRDMLRLEHLLSVVSSRPAKVEISLSSQEVFNAIASLEKPLLIINATGMGKDLPGSPWPDELPFPKNSYLWELNYRGSLEFYHQGKSQENDRNLTVVDGWRYFIYGWTQVISEVFDVMIDQELLKKLEIQAEASR